MHQWQKFYILALTMFFMLFLVVQMFGIMPSGYRQLWQKSMLLRWHKISQIKTIKAKIVL